MLKEGLAFADRYKLIKQLGRGGFSEVWLAEDNLTKVQVAVKIYAPGTGLDDNGIKIFTQEFSLVFDMNHTNLLRPTHFDCWDRMPYLIMPLIKNGSAFNYIAEGKMLPEEECWKMLHDVAAGLAYLHEKTPPLIHQDIKPDNILIDDEGRYLITDFGISARVRSTIRGAEAKEQSGGTLAYMGPERFSSSPKPIMASDVWSLGAMMYELMTGLPPFGNHGGLLQKNGADIPIIEGDYSKELKDIIYSCITKETWDRPSAKKIEDLTYKKIHHIETSLADTIKPAVEPEELAMPPQPDVPEAKLAEEPVSQAESVNQAVQEPVVSETTIVEPTPSTNNQKAQKGKSEKKNGKKGHTSNQPAAMTENQPATMMGNMQASAQAASKTPITNATQTSKPAAGPAFSPKKSQPHDKSNNKGMILGGIAVAVVLIGILIAVFSGGSSDKAEVVNIVPRINYDSIALVKIDEALNVRMTADTIIQNHPDNYTDAQFSQVEDVYIHAYKLLNDVLTDRDSLSAQITSRVAIEQKTIQNALLPIYENLAGGAEFVPQFGPRAENIKPYIKDMLSQENPTESGDVE